MAIRKKTLLLVLFGYLIGNIIPLLKVQTLIQTTDDSSARQTDCDCSRTRCTGKVDITESGIEKATDRQAIFNSKKRPRLLSQELSFRQPLFIGVVTARNLLSTRANAIYKTWGKLAPKLYFFSSPSLEKSHNLPIISLPGVDDTYPPQKKVFRMLEYMYTHHLNDYNWFMRCDDDVYIRIDKLMKFISELDPSIPLYIGSPGIGKPEDRERLQLLPHEVYCMGGPGVIFSRALLERIGPYIEECLQEVVVSYNEDVEVGRCISRILGVQCTWSYQAAKIFYTDYSKGEVFLSPEVYHHKDILNAISIHPFKQPNQMESIHQFYLEVKNTEYSRESIELQNELKTWQSITRKNRIFAES